jgi:hypothetical protein
MSKTAQIHILALALSASWLSGCATHSKPAPEAAKPAVDQASQPQLNNFPTLTRIEYVLQCMEQHGGQNYDNLYHCACSIDHIASKMTYEEFDQAQAFTYLFNTPGERGGEFRDPPQSEKLRTLLKSTKAEAAEKCFPAVVKKPAAETTKKK